MTRFPEVIPMTHGPLAMLLALGLGPAGAAPPPANESNSAARAIIEEARTAARLVDAPDRKAALLAEVGGAQARAGDRDGARTTLPEAMEVVDAIPQQSAQLQPCAAIAGAYLLLSDVDG